MYIFHLAIAAYTEGNVWSSIYKSIIEGHIQIVKFCEIQPRKTKFRLDSLEKIMTGAE